MKEVFETIGLILLFMVMFVPIIVLFIRYLVWCLEQCDRWL